MSTLSLLGFDSPSKAEVIKNFWFCFSSKVPFLPLTWMNKPKLAFSGDNVGNALPNIGGMVRHPL